MMRKTILCLLIVLLSFPIPVAGQEEHTYTAPDASYLFPVPTNWAVEELGAYVKVASPGEGVVFYMLTLEGDDPDAAIEEAWALIDPDFDLEVQERQEYTDQSVTEGAEKVVVLSYAQPTPEAFYQGIAQIYEDVSYVILFQGDITTIQQRSAQISIISSGYQIAAIEQEVLTDAEPVDIDETTLAALESYIYEKMEDFEVVGASVAIVSGDEVIYINGFGETGEGSPVSPETLFMIGSTTKTMTTMLMGTLIDDGAMAWDTPVVEVLPQFAVKDPDMTQTITVQNLVCACTGVPRRDLELFFNTEELTAEGIVDSLGTFEFFTEFGEAFQYSNQMVAAGGYVAAAAGGGGYGTLYDDYVALMQARIFDPIGMDHSTFDFDAVHDDDNYALPYLMDAVGDYEVAPIEVEEWSLSIAPAGGLWSNALDMSRYLMTLINRGESPEGTRVISEENLLFLWEPQVDISAEASYGLGWIVEDYKGLTVISHGGNMLGYTTELAILPEAEVGIVILNNQRLSIFNTAVRYRLIELLYGLDAEFESQLDVLLADAEENREEARAAVQDEIDAEVRAAAIGAYDNAELGRIDVLEEEGNLSIDAGGFVVNVRAVENDEGEIEYQLFDMGLGGLPVKFEGDTLILGIGAVEYTFERAE